MLCGSFYLDSAYKKENVILSYYCNVRSKPTWVKCHQLDRLKPVKCYNNNNNYIVWITMKFVHTFTVPRGWILLTLVTVFPLAPPWGWYLWFLVKRLSNYWMDCHEIFTHIHGSLRMNCNNSGEPLTFLSGAIIKSNYSQIPAKLTAFPSASAVLCV